jgi:hypothetical protein
MVLFETKDSDLNIYVVVHTMYFMIQVGSVGEVLMQWVIKEDRNPEHWGSRT